MFIAGTHLGEEEHLLVLGLSAENRARLAEGKPMDISRATHGIAIPAGLKIVIFAGETEADMERMMAPMIGPETVRNQRKLI